jgi:hypothetical protein
MKKLLSLVLVFMLVATCFTISSISAKNDYIIFQNGLFQNGGQIADGCTAIISGKYLVGGEGLYDAFYGNGTPINLIIDQTGSAMAFRNYKYLGITVARVTINDVSTGVYFPGTVAFGQGNNYNFNDIEKDGRGMNQIPKFGTFYLDLSKVTEFKNNELNFIHANCGYQIAGIWLTDNPTEKGITDDDGKMASFTPKDYTSKLSSELAEKLKTASDDDIFWVQPSFNGSADLSTLEEDIIAEIGFGKADIEVGGLNEYKKRMYCKYKGWTLEYFNSIDRDPIDQEEFARVTANANQEWSDKFDLYRATEKRLTDDKIAEYYYSCMEAMGLSKDCIAHCKYYHLWVQLSLNLSAKQIREILPSPKLRALSSFRDSESDAPYPYTGEDGTTPEQKIFTAASKNIFLKVEVDKDIRVGKPFYINATITNRSDKDIYYTRNTFDDPFDEVFVTFPDGKILNMEKVNGTQTISNVKIEAGERFIQRVKMLAAFPSDGENSYFCPDLSAAYTNIDKRIENSPVGLYQGKAKFTFTFKEGQYASESEMDEEVSLDFNVNVKETKREIITKIKDDLKLTVVLNKPEYTKGEDVYLTAFVKNIGAEEIHYKKTFTSDDYYGVKTSIKSKDGRYFINTADFSDTEPLVTEVVLKPGKEIRQDMKFKSGFLTSEYTGTFNPSKDTWDIAPAGTYNGNCSFVYSYEEGFNEKENAELLDLDFDVVIKNPNTFTTTQDGINLTAKLDKYSYEPGENIKIDVSAKSFRDGTVYLAGGGQVREITAGIKCRDDGSSFFVDGYKYSGTFGTTADYYTRPIKKGETRREYYTFRVLCYDSSLEPTDVLDASKGCYFIPNPGTYIGEVWVHVTEDPNGNTGNSQKIKLTFPVVIKDTEKEPDVESGLEFTVTPDKESYKYGEDVTAQITLKNNNDYTMALKRTVFNYNGMMPTLSKGDVKYTIKSCDGNNSLDPAYWTLPKNSENKMTVTFKPPQDNYSAGTYTLKVEATYFEVVFENGEYKGIDYDKEHTITTSVDIKIEPEEFDLYTSSATTSKANLTDGETTAFSTVVRNVSDKDLEKEITVNFYMNGKLFDTVTEVKEIEAGKFAVITSNEEKELYFGTHTISTEVKISDDTAVDTDTSNNRVKTRIKVLDE